MFVAGCFFTIHPQQYYCASSTLGFGKVVDQIHSQEHSTFQHASWPTKVSYVWKVSFWGKIILVSRIFNMKEQSCFEKPSIPGRIAKQLTMHYSFIILKLKYSNKKNMCKKPQKAFCKFLTTVSISETLQGYRLSPRKIFPPSHLCRCLASHIVVAACHFKVPKPHRIHGKNGILYLHLPHKKSTKCRQIYRSSHGSLWVKYQKIVVWICRAICFGIGFRLLS